jgi:hypothetical protein
MPMEGQKAAKLWEPSQCPVIRLGETGAELSPGPSNRQPTEQAFQWEYHCNEPRDWFYLNRLKGVLPLYLAYTFTAAGTKVLKMVYGFCDLRQTKRHAHII